MAKGKKPAGGKTSKLVAHSFLPTLVKPNSVIGDYIAMQGKEWTGCPPPALASPAP